MTTNLKVAFPEKKPATEKQLSLINNLVEKLEASGVEVVRREVEDIGHANTIIKLLLALETVAKEVQGE